MFKEPDRRRIYLLRHAEAAYLQAGRHAGPRHARRRIDRRRTKSRRSRQSEVLADVEFDRAVCSGLPRTRATAGFILAGRDRHLRWKSFRRSKKSAAAIASRRIADMETLDQARRQSVGGCGRKPDSRFLGGERFVDFEHRVVPAFNALVARSQLAHVADRRAWRRQSRDAEPRDESAVARRGQHRAGRVLHQHHRRRHGRGRVERYLVRGVNITGYNLSKPASRSPTWNARRNASRAGSNADVTRQRRLSFSATTACLTCFANWRLRCRCTAIVSVCRACSRSSLR